MFAYVELSRTSACRNALYQVPVERVVQRHVPIDVERVVTRQIPVPYPVDKVVTRHIPVPVEKVIDRRVPVCILSSRGFC